MRLARAWQIASAQTDRHRRLLDCEKVVEQALTEAGFQGSFSEKLQRAGPRFQNIQPLWEAHKLRNRIAHEVGVQLSEQETARAARAFERALKDLGV